MSRGLRDNQKVDIFVIIKLSLLIFYNLNKLYIVKINMQKLSILIRRMIASMGLNRSMELLKMQKFHLREK